MIEDLTNNEIFKLMNLLGKHINDKDKMIEIIEKHKNKKRSKKKNQVTK